MNNYNIISDHTTSDIKPSNIKLLNIANNNIICVDSANVIYISTDDGITYTKYTTFINNNDDDSAKNAVYDFGNINSVSIIGSKKEPYAVACGNSSSAFSSKPKRGVDDHYISDIYIGILKNQKWEWHLINRRINADSGSGEWGGTNGFGTPLTSISNSIDNTNAYACSPNQIVIIRDANSKDLNQNKGYPPNLKLSDNTILFSISNRSDGFFIGGDGNSAYCYTSLNNNNFANKQVFKNMNHTIISCACNNDYICLCSNQSVYIYSAKDLSYIIEINSYNNIHFANILSLTIYNNCCYINENNRIIYKIDLTTHTVVSYSIIGTITPNTTIDANYIGITNEYCILLSGKNIHYLTNTRNLDLNPIFHSAEECNNIAGATKLTSDYNTHLAAEQANIDSGISYNNHYINNINLGVGILAASVYIYFLSKK